MQVHGCTYSQLIYTIFQISIGSSIFEQESRELTPVLTPTATPLSTPVATPQLTEKKVKKRKPALFSKIRKSTGKRGSVGECGVRADQVSGWWFGNNVLTCYSQAVLHVVKVLLFVWGPQVA